MTASPRRRTYPVLLPRELPASGGPRRLRRTHPVARGLVVVFLLALPLLGRVWLETEAAQGGYRLRALRQEVAQLEQEQQRLRTQVAALRSPERLERLAADLGLTVPAPNQLAAVRVPVATTGPRPETAGLAWWQRVVRLLHDPAASAAEPGRP